MNARSDKPLPVLCIVGPTASGKTDVAQIVARALDGEVISADSMQIYRGMDIGTGKLPVSERIVTHHGFDLVDPGEPYSAALFQAFGRACVDDIRSRGKLPVICGGTGQYVQAVIDDFRFPAGDQAENPVRERYHAIAEAQGAHRLWEMLRERDPESAALIHENNVRRVVRAFELLEEGTTYAAQKEKLAGVPPYLDAVQFGLAVEPAVLNERIEARVDKMLDQGLVAEVKRLRAAGFEEGLTAMQAIGYKEIIEALHGTLTLDEAAGQIKTATRRYGKRQRTWFRRDKRIRWVNADMPDAGAIASEILSQWESATAG